ncbi:DUF6634 family protein [Microvirga guangxiensis]|uniref:DUF6634 family protein n=1 Tax=Microvirga guangxiensis TaxID=549386 RepID=UPI000B813C1F
MIVVTNSQGVNEALVSHEIDRLLRLAADLQSIRDGRGPTATDLRGAPVLGNWRHRFRPAACLVGDVRHHPMLPGMDRPIVTSDIWVLAPDRGWARTLSRWYRLGRPSGVSSTS